MSFWWRLGERCLYGFYRPHSHYISRIPSAPRSIPLSMIDDSEGVSLGLSVVGSGGEELRPVRRALSAEMRAKVEVDSKGTAVEDGEMCS